MKLFYFIFSLLTSAIALFGIYQFISKIHELDIIGVIGLGYVIVASVWLAVLCYQGIND
jgi:uncharacterized iron-regulated membrane protein